MRITGSHVLDTLLGACPDIDLDILPIAYDMKGYIFGRGDRLLMKETQGDLNSYHTGAE